MSGRAPFFALIDASAGLAIFGLLGCGLILIITLLGPGGVPLIDLKLLFEDLSRNPGSYWWLAVMLISTLLPTALHLGLGIATLFTLWPGFARGWIADQFEKADNGDVLAGRIGRWAMTLGSTLSVGLPLIVIWEGGGWLIAHWCWVLDYLIGVFASFFELISGETVDLASTCRLTGPLAPFHRSS